MVLGRIQRRMEKKEKKYQPENDIVFSIVIKLYVHAVPTHTPWALRHFSLTSKRTFVLTKKPILSLQFIFIRVNYDSVTLGRQTTNELDRQTINCFRMSNQ